jgi:hypothetical protein
MVGRARMALMEQYVEQEFRRYLECGILAPRLRPGSLW